MNNPMNWSDNDSDYVNEMDEEIIKNDNPLPEISKEFRDNVLNVKHSLYNNIVLSPELGTQNAQNNEVLQDYLEKINKVYILSLSAENGKKIPEEALLVFPEESRKMIRVTLDWILNFFKNNHISDTVPYSDHIRKSFHDYQFVQNNSFEDD
jgi:hypothetical protein